VIIHKNEPFLLFYSSNSLENLLSTESRLSAEPKSSGNRFQSVYSSRFNVYSEPGRDKVYPQLEVGVAIENRLPYLKVRKDKYATPHDELTMNYPPISIELPAWVQPLIAAKGTFFPSIEERMALVIELAARNVTEKTGGPFGAAVFSIQGQLIAPGVNLVTSANCSILHAEMVALALAQKTLGRFDLSDNGKFSFDLAASTEPCAMCFGAIPWSGVNRLLCGARDADARAIGFDEGPKLPDWQAALQARGITVIRDLLRPEAIATLQAYAASGGAVY